MEQPTVRGSYRGRKAWKNSLHVVCSHFLMYSFWNFCFTLVVTHVYLLYFFLFFHFPWHYYFVSHVSPSNNFFWSPFSKLIWSFWVRFLIPYFHTQICPSWGNNKPVLTLKLQRQNLQLQRQNRFLKCFTSKSNLIHASASKTQYTEKMLLLV